MGKRDQINGRGRLNFKGLGHFEGPSVIIRNFYVVGIVAFHPNETDTPLIVCANAMLTGTNSLKKF